MKEKKFDNFIIICIVLFTGLMIFHGYITYRLIWEKFYFPILIYLIGTILGLGILIVIRRAIFNFEESFRFFLTDFVTIVKNLFLAVVVFGSMSSWLFDYLNMKFIDSAESTFEKCKVYNVILSSSGTHNTVNFDFFGKEQSINNFTASKSMKEAYKQGKYDKCYLNLTFKKGLLTSYIIEDYSFVIED
jgi:hypothetical protein